MMVVEKLESLIDTVEQDGQVLILLGKKITDTRQLNSLM